MEIMITVKQYIEYNIIQISTKYVQIVENMLNLHQDMALENFVLPVAVKIT